MKYLSFLTAGIVLAISVAVNVWAEGCNVTTIPFHFGNYNTLNASPLDAAGEVHITCDNGISYGVKLDGGISSEGSFNPRKMRRLEGNYMLNYNFYRDAARTEIWGDGTGNTFVQSGTSSGIDHVLTLFGRIPARQKVAAGHYTDKVTVIVEW